MDKIRIGVIGVRFGRQLVRTLVNMENGADSSRWQTAASTCRWGWRPMPNTTGPKPMTTASP